MTKDPTSEKPTRVEKAPFVEQEQPDSQKPEVQDTIKDAVTEESQKPAGGGWAVVVGGTGDVESEEDRLRGELDEQKERYKKLFKINEDLWIKYKDLEREHTKLASDPQYKGLSAQVEKLRASKEDSNNKYVALMDQNSQLKKKQNRNYALIGSTGAFLGFLAGALLSDCAGDGKYESAGHLRDAWDSGLYAQGNEVIDEKENQISDLEKKLADCKTETDKLSKRPKYCPKPKAAEPVVCPPQPECPYIKQY